MSAVADVDPAAASEAGERFGLGADRIYQDPLQAIAGTDYDAVAVLMPNPGKTRVLTHALRTGRPVFTEKPLCYTVDDLRRIRAAAAESGAKLMVSQNYRFDPQVRGVRKLVQDHQVWGRLKGVLVDFARKLAPGDSYVKRLEGGLGLNAEMCIHHYDLMRYLLGSDPRYIEASARQSPRSGMAGLDTLDVCLEFDRLVSVRYHATYAVEQTRTPWGGEWTLDFEEGSLYFRPYANGEHPIRYRGRWQDSWRPDEPHEEGSSVYRHNLVAEAFDEFTHAIEEGREPECSLSDNTHSVAVMLAVEEAARTGDTIDFAEFITRCIGA